MGGLLFGIIGLIAAAGLPDRFDPAKQEEQNSENENENESSETESNDEVE